MINNNSKIVNQNLGSSFLLPAHGRAGARATINNNSPSAFEKILAKPRSKRAKRKGGLGEMNFCPPAVPRSGTEGGKRFRNSALAEYQNRKIFFSLIEKIFAGRRLNKCLENFSVLLGGSEADAVRKRWAGLSPCGRQSEVSIRILFKVGSNFIQKTPPFYDFGFLIRCCLALASLGLGKSNDFIGIFEIKKQFSLQNLEVRFAEGEHKLKNLLTNLFCSAKGGTQSGNFSREAGLTA